MVCCLDTICPLKLVMDSTLGHQGDSGYHYLEYKFCLGCYYLILLLKSIRFFSTKETHRETRNRLVWTYKNSRIFTSNVQYYQRQSKKTARSINLPRGEEEEKQSWINTEHCTFNHSHTARWRLIYPATLHPVSRPCTCEQKQRRDKHLPSVYLLALPLSFELYKRYHTLKQKNKLLNLVK